MCGECVLMQHGQNPKTPTPTHFKPNQTDTIQSRYHQKQKAAALLLFNEADELSYAEVRQRLNLPEEDVTRLLHSLACAKYAILKKEPEGKALSKTDRFAFNADFTDR